MSSPVTPIIPEPEGVPVEDQSSQVDEAGDKVILTSGGIDEDDIIDDTSVDTDQSSGAQ